MTPRMQALIQSFNTRMNALAQNTFDTKKEKQLEGIAKAGEARKRNKK